MVGSGCQLAGGIIGKPYLRAAFWAGYRLCVKASVGWFGVLAAAGIAHLESEHRRIASVVWDGFYDRIPRPAIGAVYERIAVSKIGIVIHLVEAVFAYGSIDGYLRDRFASLIAGKDDESFIVSQRNILDIAGSNIHERNVGARCLQTPGKLSELFRGALSLDGNAAGIVEYVAGKLKFRRKPEYKRPTANALHATGYLYTLSFKQNSRLSNAVILC